MGKLKLDSRAMFVAALGVATALGCSQKLTVVDPPASPNPTSTPPVFGGFVHQAPTAPPPISGGTLITITKADKSAIAIAADPEDDALHVVSLGTQPALVGTLALEPGDQPGRMVADAGGRVHVVLRGGGGIATIVPDQTGASLVSRRSVCSAPRGIDYNAANDSVYVVCATGEIVVLPAAGGAATATADLGRDLRDVVIDAGTVYVTRFRTAEILTLNSSLGITGHNYPPSPSVAGNPEVAWRTVRQNGGGLRMVYQVASSNPIDLTTPPGVSSYGGPSIPQNNNGSSGGVVSVASASFSGGTISNSTALVSNPVVDIATGINGFETVSITGMVETSNGIQAQIAADDGQASGSPDQFVAIADAQAAANPVIVVQRRGATPALFVISSSGGSVDLAGATMIKLPQKALHEDTGFDVFHMPTGAGVACMDCHPEGGDDGHTWQFQLTSETRARRTQSLRGGVVSDSAPYHWDGDMANLQVLCDEVFTHRMGGGSVNPNQMLAVSRFIGAMPRVPVKANLNQDRLTKGQAIFNGAGGCAGCHIGGTGTLPMNQDVGKIDSQGVQAPLQVPMLVGVADRAPYMHDGCAATLMDRLTNPDCAGSHHGNTAQLTTDDQSNLIEYLQSL